MVREQLCVEAADTMLKHLKVLSITNDMSEAELIETVAVFSAACARPAIRGQFEIAQRDAFNRLDGNSGAPVQ